MIAPAHSNGDASRALPAVRLRHDDRRRTMRTRRNVVSRTRVTLPAIGTPRAPVAAAHPSRGLAPAALLALGGGVLAWLGAIAWIGADLADPLIATAVVTYVSLPFVVFFKPGGDRRRYRR